jgi:hypothetical protein
VRADDLVHANRQCEIVGRKLEEWVSSDIHFVKEDARQERRQSERLSVRDEVDFVSTIGQRDSKLRRHGAGAAVGRVTGDANLHSDLSHHSRTIDRA